MSIQQVGHTTASNLRAEIARQNRKRGDLARVLGLSPAAGSRRISGETPLDVNELCAAAEWLDVPVTVLIGEGARVGRDEADESRHRRVSDPQALPSDSPSPVQTARGALTDEDERRDHRPTTRRYLPGSHELLAA